MPSLGTMVSFSLASKVGLQNDELAVCFACSLIAVAVSNNMGAQFMNLPHQRSASDPLLGETHPTRSFLVALGG